MKFLAAVVLLSVVLASTSSPNTDAPTGFDNKSNGMVDDAIHQDDQAKFDDTETVADGLGPLYNAQSCRECHQNPTSGGTSQVAELRVGHQGPDQFDQGLVRHGLHKTVSQEAQRYPRGADVLASGHVLLDFCVGKSGVWTDRAIIHQSATSDDLCSVGNRDVRVMNKEPNRPMPVCPGASTMGT